MNGDRGFFNQFSSGILLSAPVKVDCSRGWPWIKAIEGAKFVHLTGKKMDAEFSSLMTGEFFRRFLIIFR